ncbi:uncharacterized protein BX664DRAFT_333601 [Halteromyces radiatus]|uniref:uncharacterized protein n=1 Tax=Halteromyces radiatus TaxID=101107 RepID=UPI00221F9E54|nr:uncharacterized protein BX664DRAFT_333601 [Halteromyces radiatus]KAI8089669.1 hypothetical protein BX664DRAFT_333601 [Halteromyces radiatus]
MHERKTSNVSTNRSTTRPPIPTSSAATTTSRRATQQRTGRASFTTKQQQQLSDEQKETQRRIAARAAASMAQVRRRQPRSFMLWGDNRKAVIKRYPDGSQEILVPQTLTSEQEQYEFPPRSRLLKKLANSTAERHRLSSLQHTITAPNVSPISQPLLLSSSTNKSIIISRPATAIEPDQNALAEWFSDRRHQHSKKEQAVMEWMTDVERSTSLLSNKKKKNKSIPRTIKNNSNNNLITSSTTHSSIQDINIKFKSEAGKLWTAGKPYPLPSSNHLLPPNENTKKHYVLRRRLIKHGNKPNIETTSTPFYYNEMSSSVAPLGGSFTTAIQTHGYHLSKVPRSSVSASPTSKSGMVQLVQMFHKTLQEQQARAHERMKQLETLLEEERSKRQDIQLTQERTMTRLDSFMKRYQEHQRRTPPSPTMSASPPFVSKKTSQQQQQQQQNQPILAKWDEWMDRINRLEARMEKEAKSRQSLQQSVTDTVERMDALKKSVARQAREHTASRRQLENQMNQAMKNLSTLTQQRKP